MKISIDGGGLCAPTDNRFGNYTFSNNLIWALGRYDLTNKYFLYSFCRKNKELALGKNIIFKKLSPKLFWSKVRVSIEECVSRKDFYLALNQSVPLASFSKIIAFSHGMSFKFYPGFYPDFERLNDQFETLIRYSDYIVVSSVRVRNEILEFKPRLKGKIVVIPFGIPFDMPLNLTYKKREKYFIHVGMDHPIKNVEFIIKAFRKFVRNKKYHDYKLYLIGYSGQIKDKSIRVIPHASRDALRGYYSKATAHLTASVYESFNFPVLEALSQGTQTIGLRESIIPELRSYVRLADDMQEFVELMEKATVRPLKVKREIAQIFSWKKYVKELMKLYKI